MESRYKVIVSNKKIYREVDLPIDINDFKIGTTVNCDLRLRKEIFFEQFEIFFSKQGSTWQLSCTENIYISVGDVRKLVAKEMKHGDIVAIKYKDSDSEIISLNFLIGFEYESKNYDRVIDLSGKNKITIGSYSNCNLIINSEYANNDLVELEKTENGYTVYDKGTMYGVYLNGIKITTSIMKNMDFLSIANFSFYLKGNNLYAGKNDDIKYNLIEFKDISMQKSALKYPRFNRNTRMKSIVTDSKITILDPPNKPMKPKNNIILSLLPAIGMLGLTVVLRGIMSSSTNTNSFVLFSVCTMSIGIITSILGFFSTGRGYRKEIKERKVKYESYIENKTNEISLAREQELKVLNNVFYDMEYNINLVNEFSGDLFNREVTDNDFLNVRLGIGKCLAIREIEYKVQEKFDGDDELFNIPEKICNGYKLIENGPVVSKFGKANAIGVIGNKDHLYLLMKNMVLDLCIRQHYNDLKLFFVVNETSANSIKWMRFLPHVKNADLNTRNIICDNESKTFLFEYLYKELSRRESEKITYPRLVIFVFDNMGIKSHPLSKYIQNASSIGVTFLFFETKKELLSQWCNEIIELKDENEGKITYCDNINSSINFKYEAVSEEVANSIAIKLAPVYGEEVSLERNLTKNISLYELLKIFSTDDLDLMSRWEKSCVYESMSAPLGVKTKEEIVCLDLHEKAHGPHGLVAGTTGSGKSEILQSYILSMATLFHPYDVNFVIIDFKGGGMANQFKKLPHLVGAITNIDGKEINRSLLSIKAELRKRQNLFADAEVNHIDKYIKKYKMGEVIQPLPHLIIIVDEFAELKAEQPEFMKELISAARIGRSLGVHLILATQKPAGQVNEQIWSNSKFKLCLKVQTKEDSNEVIKSPLASEITEPGRAYFQVGNNEIFELFQSAYSGGPDKLDDAGSRYKEFDISALELSGKRKVIFRRKQEKTDGEIKSQLEAIVDYVEKYCVNCSINKLPSICLPSLDKSINYPNCLDFTEKNDYEIGIGVFDDPENQYQGTSFIDISNCNTMILGSAQYGKTNLLQVIIRQITQKYSPEEATIYIIDFASMVLKNFEDLDHVGGVVCSSDDEKLKNLFKLINTEIVERKEKLLSAGVSSFTSYREAGYKDIPQIVLIIDNIIALKELYLQEDDVLLKICREGISVGVSLIVTSAQTAGIGYKYLSNFANRISLYCNDSNEYANLFSYCKIKPENIQGRCLIEIDKSIYECQTFLAFQGEREIDRVKQISLFIEESNSKSKGMCRAKQIPVIPTILTDKYIESQFGNLMNKGEKIVNALDYSTVAPNIVDFHNFCTIGLCGKEKSGKGNYVRYFVNSLQNISDSSAEVFIIDDVRKKFVSLQKNTVVKKHTIDSNEIIEILKSFNNKLEQRYLKLTEGEGFTLSNEPLLVLIIQNQDVFNVIDSNKEILEIYKKITTKYRALKLAIIYSDVSNNLIAYNAPEPLKMLKEDRHFMIFDDLNNVKIIDIPLTITRDFKKEIEIGDSYYIKDNKYSKLKMALCTTN